MEWVSIQEASHILNVSQDVIRRYARDGRLNARKQPKETGGTSWVVELPDGPWEDDFKENVHSIAQRLTPWWWAAPEKEGVVHYVDGLGIEEIEALFMCGLMTNNIYSAVGHDLSDRCPECIEEVVKQGLPMETRE